MWIFSQSVGYARVCGKYDKWISEKISQRNEIMIDKTNIERQTKKISNEN